MNNKTILSKAAAILAFVIGAMAVIAGGQVIVGILPDYYVIPWLPIYNFTIGVSSLLISVIAIWKNNRLAIPLSITTFSLHALVMFIIKTSYRDVVASDSIKAMTIRMIIWLIIIILLYAQQTIRANKTKGEQI
jgi:hypothetical protein